jgi:hypothetical protein
VTRKTREIAAKDVASVRVHAHSFDDDWRFWFN